jgi:hypothetical protein
MVRDSLNRKGENMPSQASVTRPDPAGAGLRGPYADTAAALVMEIADMVREPSVTEAHILKLLNRALLDVAGRVGLPGLAAENTVVVPPGESFADLPADFHHGLMEVVCLTTRRRVRLCASLEELGRLCGERARVRPSALVLAAAQSGSRLYVRPVQSVPAVLLARYFRLPRPLRRIRTNPTACAASGPELLISRVCRDLFEVLEEGVGGKKVQTGRFAARFAAAMAISPPSRASPAAWTSRCPTSWAFSPGGYGHERHPASGRLPGHRRHGPASAASIPIPARTMCPWPSTWTWGRRARCPGGRAFFRVAEGGFHSLWSDGGHAAYADAGTAWCAIVPDVHDPAGVVVETVASGLTPGGPGMFSGRGRPVY